MGRISSGGMMFKAITTVAALVIATSAMAQDDLTISSLAKGETTKTAPLCDAVIGKHAVYFEFISEAEDTVASFDKFTFDR